MVNDFINIHSIIRPQELNPQQTEETDRSWRATRLLFAPPFSPRCAMPVSSHENHNQPLFRRCSAAFSNHFYATARRCNFSFPVRRRCTWTKRTCTTDAFFFGLRSSFGVALRKWTGRSVGSDRDGRAAVGKFGCIELRWVLRFRGRASAIILIWLLSVRWKRFRVNGVC